MWTLFFSLAVLRIKRNEATQLSCLLALETPMLFAQPKQWFSCVLNSTDFESTKPAAVCLVILGIA